MRDGLVRKGLVLGIIILFVGVGIYPAIAENLNTSTKENTSNELIEFPIQIFGYKGVKSYKISLTKHQYDDLQVQIERFKKDFDNADTMKKSVEVYRNMVASLNEFGLLPEGMSIIEAEKLIMGPYYYLDKLGLLSDKTINEELPSHTDGILVNIMCLLCSQTSWSWTFTLWPLGVLGIFLVFYGNEYNYDSGWILTKSILKNWSFEGKFIGGLGTFGAPPIGYDYIGARGFIGFFLILRDFIIGHAGLVRIICH